MKKMGTVIDMRYLWYSTNQMRWLCSKHYSSPCGRDTRWTSSMCIPSCENHQCKGIGPALRVPIRGLSEHRQSIREYQTGGLPPFSAKRGGNSSRGHVPFSRHSCISHHLFLLLTWLLVSWSQGLHSSLIMKASNNCSIVCNSEKVGKSLNAWLPIGNWVHIQCRFHIHWGLNVKHLLCMNTRSSASGAVLEGYGVSLEKVSYRGWWGWALGFYNLVLLPASWLQITTQSPPTPKAMLSPGWTEFLLTLWANVNPSPPYLNFYCLEFVTMTVEVKV